MLKKLQRYIEQNQLISPRDTLLVGVSGGADSVFLLHALDSLKYSLALNIHVAHYNHNLRKDADKDRIFVQRLAEQRGLPFHTETWRRKKTPRNFGATEEKARKKRLAFLVKTAKKIHADAVVLAHHKDDLAETVLMRLIRGTGTKGMQAILPIRELFGIRFIRPLLCVTKKEILCAVKKHQFAFRLDPSNKNTAFFRNRVRHELMPLLERHYNPGIQDALIHYAENAAQDYQYLLSQAQKAFQKSLSKKTDSRVDMKITALKTLPLPLRNMVFRLGVEELKGDTTAITSAHLKAANTLLLSEPKGTELHLPHGIIFKKTVQNINIYKK